MPGTPSRLNEPLPPTPNNPAGETMASIESRIVPPQSPTHLTVAGAPSASTSARATSSSRSRSRPASPTFLPPDSPAINLIRETLYAALGEVIASTPSIKSLMQTDPARAYYASVALSILTVSVDCITVDGGVITPLGRVLTIQECPEGYRPLMAELGRISKKAKEIETEDNDRAIVAVRAGEASPEPRLDRVRRMLEFGVAREEARYDAYEPPSVPPQLPTRSTRNVPPTTTNAGGLQSPTPALPPRRTPPPPMPVPTIPSAPIQTNPVEERQRRSMEQDPVHITPESSGANGSPRSSSEQPRGRKLLQKLRPGSAGGNNNNANPSSSSMLPPVAPKPLPPSASPSRYAAPTSPPPSRNPIPNPDDSPQSPGMAGIGARPGGVGVGGGGGGAVANAGSASPPRAAMMLHQGSLNAASGPYGSALGSGARIPGTDSGITVAPNQSQPPLQQQHHHAQAASMAPSTSTTAPVTRPPATTTGDNPRRSLEGTAVQFANRINGLALQLTRLRMFQERQDMVFKILASVHD
ncbi:hypothetical protein FRC18_006442 [Serendipita sp. 400]|nr:hypothetical protein FRC18_006442 [Serendipita sp. 400]